MMDVKIQAILDAALVLSESERAEVAAQLLATLGPDDHGLSDDELEVELKRRLDECRADPSSTISWAELRDET